MGQQAEGKFKTKVVGDLRKYFGHGIKVFPTQERGRAGVLDLNVCLYGFHIEIELKVDGQKPTRLQQLNIDRVIKAGGLAFCSTPSEWSQHFVMLVERYGKFKPLRA